MPTRRGEPTQFLGDPGEVVGDLREHPNQGAGDQCGGSSALSGVSALDLYAPSVGVSHDQQRVYGIVVPNVSAASPDGRLMENNMKSMRCSGQAPVGATRGGPGPRRSCRCTELDPLTCAERRAGSADGDGARWDPHILALALVAID